jgi:hypothetical protein
MNVQQASRLCPIATGRFESLFQQELFELANGRMIRFPIGREE